MKTISLLVLVFGTFTMNAQKWHSKEYSTLDFQINFMNNYRSFDFNSDNEIHSQRIIELYNTESSKSSWGLGLAYSHGMSKRMLFSVGLSYSQWEYKTNQLSFSVLSDTEISNAFLGYAEGEKFNSAYRFISLPFKWRYIFSKQTCKSYLEMGLAAHYYVGSKLRAENADTFEQAFLVNENISPFQLSGMIAVGSEWPINEFFTAYSQLNVFSQLSPITKHGIEERFYGLGIEFGVRKFI